MHGKQGKGKWVCAHFGAITERGVEPREIMINTEDLVEWVRKLDVLEKDMDGMIGNLLAGKGAILNLKDPISTVLLKLAER